MKTDIVARAPLEIVKGVVDQFRETIPLLNLNLNLNLTEHAENPRGWRDLPRADETPRGNIGLFTVEGVDPGAVQEPANDQDRLLETAQGAAVAASAPPQPLGVQRPDRYNTVSSRTLSVALYVTLIADAEPL